MKEKHIPKWKFALLIWIAIYPSITTLQYLIGEYLIKLAIPLRTLILTGILVPLMVFILLPILKKIFHKWLHQ